MLKVHGYPFSVYTPSGGVRLISDKTSEDFIELSLDTTGDEPAVIGHSSRSRGRRIVETERPIAEGPIPSIADEQVLEFLMKELAPLVER